MNRQPPRTGNDLVTVNSEYTRVGRIRINGDRVTLVHVPRRIRREIARIRHPDPEVAFSVQFGEAETETDRGVVMGMGRLKGHDFVGVITDRWTP